MKLLGRIAVSVAVAMMVGAGLGGCSGGDGSATAAAPAPAGSAPTDPATASESLPAAHVCRLVTDILYGVSHALGQDELPTLTQGRAEEFVATIYENANVLTRVANLTGDPAAKAVTNALARHYGSIAASRDPVGAFFAGIPDAVVRELNLLCNRTPLPAPTG